MRPTDAPLRFRTRAYIMLCIWLAACVVFAFRCEPADALLGMIIIGIACLFLLLTGV